MALVLRKVFTPWKLTVLRNFKPKHLSTAITRTPPNLSKRDMSPDLMIRSHTTANRTCYTKAFCTTLDLFKTTSNLRQRKSLPNLVNFNRTISITHTNLYPHTTSPKYAEAEPPCTPCCGQLLPPPSNCPPKCINYVTGYYYYPYGLWFAGPYHVKIPCACGSCPPSLAEFTSKCSCICPSCTVCVNPKSEIKPCPSPPLKPFNQRNPEKPRVSFDERALPAALKAFHKFHLKQRPKSHLGKVLPVQYAYDNLGNKSKGIKDANNQLPSIKSNNTQYGTRRSPADTFPNLVLPKIYEFMPTTKPDSIQLENRIQLPTKYERDNPVFPSDGFSFSSMPKYTTPFPIPENGVDFHKVNSKARN